MNKLKKISITKIAVLLPLIVITTSCNKMPKATKYTNPVVAKSLPDPTIIDNGDGYFYLYATEDTRNVPIYKTKNLVDWEFAGTAFTDSTRPNFEPKGGIWAPDINKINNKYVLYYSMSVWGGEWTCGIGTATANNADGPFTDNGLLLRSNQIGVQNSIDPFFITENGENYLFWGSFRGIFYTRLSANGLSLHDSTTVTQIAGTAFEGTYIYKHNNYYYLFASVGSCCEGVNSTYRLVVGRSNSLFGPYVNQAGDSMLNNAYELVIDKNERFVGNGHNSEIIADKKQNLWILYHGVDVNQPQGRVLLLDQIVFDKNGWPKLKNNKLSPSLQANKPVF